MKILSLLLLTINVAFCLFGCDNEAPLSGGGESKITGSLVYFYGNGENALQVFCSEDKENKEIILSKENTYMIGLRPSFTGSKEAVYIGNCATFSVADGCCEITYVGDKDDRSVYALKVNADYDFDLTISVGGYTQTIKIRVIKVENKTH